MQESHQLEQYCQKLCREVLSSSRFSALSHKNSSISAGFRTDGSHQLVLIEVSGEYSLDEKILVEHALLKSLHEDAETDGLGFECRFRRPESDEAKTRELPSPQSSAASLQPVAPFGLDYKRRAIPMVRDIVAVAAGKGGVGKSTVAAGLAVALQERGQRVGLLDADVYGPSVPTLFDLQGALQVEKGGRLQPMLSRDLRCMSFGLFGSESAAVMWRGPLLAKTLTQFLYDVNWGELDTLIVDLPPGTGDIPMSLVEMIALSGVVLVSTPQALALADARRAVSMFKSLNVPILGLVENMAHTECSQCGHQEALMDSSDGEGVLSLAEARLLARLPLSQEVRRMGDVGGMRRLQEGAVPESFANLANDLDKMMKDM